MIVFSVISSDNSKKVFHKKKKTFIKYILSTFLGQIQKENSTQNINKYSKSQKQN